MVGTIINLNMKKYLLFIAIVINVNAVVAQKISPKEEAYNLGNLAVELMDFPNRSM